jgi:Flp pilus assembly protein TadD
MAVRPTDALICPACRTRNRVGWDFCVRCGEALEGVTLTEAPAPASMDADETPPEELQDRRSGSQVLVLAGLAFVVLVAAAWRFAPEAPGRPRPLPFNIVPPPPAQAAGAAAADSPGTADFEEGRRLLSRGEAAAAIPLLSKAVAAAPGNAIFHDLLGQAFWATGARQLAFAQYDEGARLDRVRFGTRLAERLAVSGRETDAAKAYEEVLYSDPENPAAQEGLGLMQYRLGNFAKAVPLLQRVASARRSDPVLQQEVAYALQASGDTPGAIAAYRNVLALAPGADTSRSLLGGLLYERGQPEAAIALLREGIEQSPQVPLLRLHLANMLERSGRPQEAAQNYHEYARLAPNAADAKELEDRAQRLEGLSEAR